MSLQTKKSTNVFLRSCVRRRYLLFMAVPGLLWMLIFNYAPMYGLIMAFTDYSLIKPIMGAPWAGFKYFIEYFQSDYLRVTLENTLGISLLKLGIAFPFTIFFAILLNEILHERLKKTVQTITYLPHFLSWTVLGTIAITWFSLSGPINDILVNQLKIFAEPIPFIADPKYFWSLAVGTEIWKETGWNSIIFLAAISGIDPEYYESAALDGAKRHHRIWYITLPSISNIIALLFILNVGYLLNSNFDQIMILSNQLNLPRSLNIDLYVYRIGISNGRFSYATAVGLAKSVVMVILLLIANTTTKRLTGKSMF